MKKQLAATLLTISFPLLFASCVSTLLQEKAPTFSKEIQYTSPESSFIKVNKAVYPAWKSKKTGNVISVVSDCNENSDVSLPQMHRLIMDSIEQPQLIKQQSISFQQRPALVYVTEGSLDGQPIQVRSMSFKRKNCGYVSSLSGRPNTLDTDQKAFDSFNESFIFE